MEQSESQKQQAQQEPPPSIHDLFKKTGSHFYSALVYALIDDNYDLIRKYLGTPPEADIWELIFKLGKDCVDPEYRLKHKISREDALYVYSKCIHQLVMNAPDCVPDPQELINLREFLDIDLSEDENDN